jgi:uncharacterized membrane protein YeiH
MKRLVFTLFIFIGSVAAARADDSAMAATMVAVVHSIWGGVVKSVSWADQTKGTKSEIVVKDAAGKITHILVTSTTTLWDADAKAIMPDKIAARDRVNVIYLTTDEGLNIGKSVKILR